MKHDPGFEADRLDDMIHGRLRLGIMAFLMAANAATFAELKARLKTTDGNLSVQLKKLESAGYVTIEKGYFGRRPLTTTRLTDEGRTAFAGYLATIKKLLDDNG